ncbi:hypothetical protein [Sphaerisporangium fuscum]|uniref:hypothetical protein n=1 Tax=Sphaerisporangium fuscum TaxID=2835868 RepID=UPI001BDCA66A|nr:hypothetical protein [Sphaerisporangium fuscum]
MSDHELIRQWKNPQGRDADLVHPAGDIVLDDKIVGGQRSTEYAFSLGCCPTDWWC